MRISSSILSLLVTASAVNSNAFAFNTPLQTLTRSTAFLPSNVRGSLDTRFGVVKGFRNEKSLPTLSMSVSVGIVGATGAVGKEIVGCLENRDFPASDVRIFGSDRSAGSQVSTKFGDVTVELFDVDKARECDVVFLAVSGDFALEHAEKLCAGDDGAVVIDNSVSSLPSLNILLCSLIFSSIVTLFLH